MKIQTVLPFLKAVDILFIAHYDPLKNFDNYFEDPYHDDIWEPKIDAATIIITTESKRHENKGYTERRNDIMDELNPILLNLRYKVKKCIRLGTITEGLSSFQLAPFTYSISIKNINLFHQSYEAAILKINNNKNALADVGFSDAMITSITDIHDKAYGIQLNKIRLKGSISDLSEANRKTINDAMSEAQKIIDGLRAMACASGNNNLKKRATKNAILKSVDPTPQKKPRNRKLKGGSAIVIATDYPAKNVIQLKLLTNDVIHLYRCNLKTDFPPDNTIILVRNVQWLGKIADIPGSGRYIKLYNATINHWAFISLFKIRVFNQK